LRARHFSARTERAYVGWIRRFILFHGKRHPQEMGALEITMVLSDLATRRRVSASTQNQALSALLFLYREVLATPVDRLEGVVRAKRPSRLPSVLTRAEVAALLARLSGAPALMARLMYGSGLRLLECARLRVKDLDLSRREILVRDGKGRKDRVTVLPESVVPALTPHLEAVKALHDDDLRAGAGYVALPDARRVTYPSAARDWAWQWVFPAARMYVDREPVSNSLLT
jgi:integron integrase